MKLPAATCPPACIGWAEGTAGRQCYPPPAGCRRGRGAIRRRRIESLRNFAGALAELGQAGEGE